MDRLINPSYCFFGFFSVNDVALFHRFIQPRELFFFYFFLAVFAFLVFYF